MFGFDPLSIGVGLALWLAFRKQANTNHGIMTPAREEVFRNAMQFGQDPKRLKDLAAEFEKQGLKPQSYWLSQRARWRERPPEVVAQHEAVFVKAMASENIPVVLEIAQLFDSLSATANAQRLRAHTEDVKRVLQERSEEIQRKAAAAKAAEQAKAQAKVAKQQDEVKAVNGASHAGQTSQERESEVGAEVGKTT